MTETTMTAQQVLDTHGRTIRDLDEKVKAWERKLRDLDNKLDRALKELETLARMVYTMKYSPKPADAETSGHAEHNQANEAAGST